MVPHMKIGERRALVIRIGALGDVLLTRRLTFSLAEAGYRTTLMAPRRHAALLLADPWTEAVIDSEDAALSEAFDGRWPRTPRGYDAAVVVSKSADLIQAASLAAREVVPVSPTPTQDGVPIGRQWADAAACLAPACREPLPVLPSRVAPPFGTDATVIHPGSGSPSKNWPRERFLALGRALHHAGHRILWIEGPAEGDDPVPAEFIVVRRPSLEALAATLAAARVFVGNDSGVSHLAGAVGAPTLAIFGPTAPHIWRPDGRRVQTVRAESGRLDDVSMEDVFEVACRIAGPPTAEA